MFDAMTPEVISGQMYSGPGSGSMVAAGTAWNTLAAELESSAEQYAKVLAGLVGEAWTGPSSAAAAASGGAHVSWLTQAAATARQAGAQATAAAEAFESALAATVPPAVITANRTQRQALASGPQAIFNLPQIAALDAAYLEYWAQDVSAMLGYAGQSASATQLTSFTQPHKNTQGDAGSGAAGSATANTAAGHAQSVIPQLLQALSGSSSGGAASSTGSGGLLGALQTGYTNFYNSLSNVMKFDGIGNVAMSVPNFGMVQFKTFFKPLSLLPDIPKAALGAGLGGNGMSSLGAGLTGPTGPLSGGFVRAISADVGGAPRVGGLSVPTGWATATPAVRLAAAAASTAAPAVDGLGAMLSPAGLGAATGGALGAVPGTRLINAGGPRTAAAGGGGGNKAPVQLDKVLAQLQKQKDTVQHWSVDEAHLDDLLEELSKKPGFHAVHLSKTPKAESIPAAAEMG